jgi:hypothetical protein
VRPLCAETASFTWSTFPKIIIHYYLL